MSYTDSTNAAGTDMFQDVDLEPGACKLVQSAGITKVKLCGPGSWKFSRMTCDKHDYKAFTIEHGDQHSTINDCQTYDLSNPAYYAVGGQNGVSGFMGSYTFDCSATGR